MHWESIGNSENDNHCLNFKSNYDKMKITSIKVNLIKYFFMRNWVLKTLYSRGFTSIEVVFHCNGCIAFSGKFFSGGTSKEVRPLERGDSPRMSRRLRPVEHCWMRSRTPSRRLIAVVWGDSLYWSICLLLSYSIFLLLSLLQNTCNHWQCPCVQLTLDSRSRCDVTRSNPPYCSRVSSQLFPLYHA